VIFRFGSQEELENKDSREKQALEIIKQKYAHFSWLITTLEKYEAQDCNEANTFEQIDKYVAPLLPLC